MCWDKLLESDTGWFQPYVSTTRFGGESFLMTINSVTRVQQSSRHVGTGTLGKGHMTSSMNMGSVDLQTVFKVRVSGQWLR